MSDSERLYSLFSSAVRSLTESSLNLNCVLKVDGLFAVTFHDTRVVLFSGDLHDLQPHRSRKSWDRSDVQEEQSRFKSMLMSTLTSLCKSHPLGKDAVIGKLDALLGFYLEDQDVLLMNIHEKFGEQGMKRKAEDYEEQSKTIKMAEGQSGQLYAGPNTQDYDPFSREAEGGYPNSQRAEGGPSGRQNSQGQATVYSSGGQAGPSNDGMQRRNVAPPQDPITDKLIKSIEQVTYELQQNIESTGGVRREVRRVDPNHKRSDSRDYAADEPSVADTRMVMVGPPIEPPQSPTRSGPAYPYDPPEQNTDYPHGDGAEGAYAADPHYDRDTDYRPVAREGQFPRNRGGRPASHSRESEGRRDWQRLRDKNRDTEIKGAIAEWTGGRRGSQDRDYERYPEAGDYDAEGYDLEEEGGYSPERRYGEEEDRRHVERPREREHAAQWDYPRGAPHRAGPQRPRFNKIFVGNLLEGTTIDQIKLLFTSFGRVTSCESHLPQKNFAFVFLTGDGPAAVDRLNGILLHKKKIIVKLANAEGPQGGRGAFKSRGGMVKKPPRPRGSAKIVVRNIAPRTTKLEIRDLFSRYGEVAGIDLRPPTEGREAFAFVFMYDDTDARAASAALNEYSLNLFAMQTEYPASDHVPL